MAAAHFGQHSKDPQLWVRSVYSFNTNNIFVSREANLSKCNLEPHSDFVNHQCSSLWTGLIIGDKKLYFRDGKRQVFLQCHSSKLVPSRTHAGIITSTLLCQGLCKLPVQLLIKCRRRWCLLLGLSVKAWRIYENRNPGGAKKRKRKRSQILLWFIAFQYGFSYLWDKKD